MPATALLHFREDIARARSLIDHAESLPAVDDSARLLRSDVLRSGWMFAVGALDAYFSDAYTDVVAATIISKSRCEQMVLPKFVDEIRVPVRAIIEPYQANANWRWRMAARRLMDDESVLKLSRIQSLFNRFFRPGRRFFGDLLDRWISHPDAKKRLLGITGRAYSILSESEQDKARKVARDQLEERFESIFQRRHDCIHNCDRPRMAPQSLVKGSTVLKVIQDIEFLVDRCDEHISSEIREFLLSCGCPPGIVSQSGY